MAYVRKKTESKQEVAYQYIKKAILSNEFAPNSMLLESNLCNLLGFSKTPIREALRRLTSEGLVEFIPEKGCFVSVLTFQEFVEIFDIREVLEGMAARFCAKNRDDLAIAGLEMALAGMRKHLETGQTEHILVDDMGYHEIMIRASRNAKLMEFIKTIHLQIKRIRIITMEDFERLELSYKEHKELTDAIIRGDADMAEDRCRVHIKSIKNFLINRHYLISSE